MTAGFRIVPAGDAAILIEFDERIDATVNAHAIHVADKLREEKIAGVRDIVPTYRSVAVYIDPVRVHHTQLLEILELQAVSPGTPARASSNVIRIPVEYGGAGGPDLAEVARLAGLDEQDVIARHAGTTYRVFMLGFVPGFAYMGTVDERIAVPRRATPRTRVPAGSVAIAGVQTGIYPFETPGGWQLIGRTTVRPFDVSRPEPSLFKAGDAVQFYPAAD